MLSNKIQRDICKSYSARVNGRVFCCECPLVKGDPEHYDFRCKANSSYNPTIAEYDYDDFVDSTIKQIKCYGEIVFCAKPNRTRQRTRQMCKVFSKGWDRC